MVVSSYGEQNPVRGRWQKEQRARTRTENAHSRHSKRMLICILNLRILLALTARFGCDSNWHAAMRCSCVCFFSCIFCRTVLGWFVCMRDDADTMRARSKLPATHESGMTKKLYTNTHSIHTILYEIREHVAASIIVCCACVCVILMGRGYGFYQVTSVSVHYVHIIRTRTPTYSTHHVTSRHIWCKRTLASSPHRRWNMRAENIIINTRCTLRILY